jgi:hypothetical protein
VAVIVTTGPNAATLGGRINAIAIMATNKPILKYFKTFDLRRVG